MHRMLHVVEIPVVSGRDVIGALHFGSSDADRNFTAGDLRLGQAIADLLALSSGRIRHRRARDRQSPDVRVNDAAGRLLADLVDPDECLP
jgi:GAF domain-containing protein